MKRLPRSSEKAWKKGKYGKKQRANNKQAVVEIASKQGRREQLERKRLPEAGIETRSGNSLAI